MQTVEHKGGGVRTATVTDGRGRPGPASGQRVVDLACEAASPGPMCNANDIGDHDERGDEIPDREASCPAPS
jgi:hypothetical protein